MRIRVFVFVCSLAGAGAAQAQGAPKGKCQFELEETPTTHLNLIQLPSGKNNIYIGGGVVARCASQKIVLKSDSLEQYGDESRFFFIGHVDYREPRLRLKSEFLTYFQKEERLLAFVNVDATLPTGSTLKGPSLEYFRAIPKVRPQQRGIATGRPTMSVIERDGQGKPQPPVNITGNTIWLESDSVFSAQGGILVERPELTATGDSLYLNAGTNLLRLMRTPKIVGTRGRPFTLVGETLDLLSRRRKLERVIAKNSAQAVSEDVTLKSDTIDLRVTDDQLQRAIAWGKSRATATSPTQTMISDSIDVLMPRQRIREIRAMRGASAEGAPDTTRYKTTERDRLMGDTIIARFDSIAVGDTVSKPRISALIAIEKATSLQHLAPQDTACRKFAVNYILGRVITVNFDSAKVKNVAVVERDAKSATGLFLEPSPDCGHTPADSAERVRVQGPVAPPAVPPSRTPPPASTPVGKPEPAVMEQL